MKNRLAPLAGAMLLSAMAPAFAADPAETARIQELERKLERSMHMIESLTRKVEQLEQAGPAAAGKPDTRVDELQKQVSDLTAANSRRSTDEGLPIHGFADIGVGSSNEDNIDRNGNRRQGNRGFTVGTFDLYLTPQFGDRVKSLLELAFEVDEAGDVATDLERVQMGYIFNDNATGWLGRFHTPYGYWNTAFHHGAQIQTAVMRPRFLDFEDKGGILPAHTTGAWINGNLPIGSSKLGYDVYAGNAPDIRIDAGNLAGTLNMKMQGGARHSTSSGFNLSLRPGNLPDLMLGVHGLNVAGVEDTLGANRTRVRMFGGYGVFNDDRWEAITEYYRFRNQDLSGSTGSHRSTAWFAQLGYSLGVVTPYGRFERTRLDQTDNYFLSQESGRSYERGVIGARYDVNAKAAIKFELNRTRQDDTGGPGLSLRDTYSEARFQYAIRF